MRLAEAPLPQNSKEKYWQKVLQHVSTGLFLLNHLLAGRYAVTFPAFVSQAPTRQTDTHDFFLPLIFVPPNDIRDNPYCSPQYPEASGYTLNAQEQEIEHLLLTDPNQTHPQLSLSIALSQAARRRAQDMADRDYVAHTNPDGFGPNCIVVQHPFVLPDDYDFSNAANNVETIAAGYDNMSVAWTTLLSSEGHSNHLLGKIPFYNEQSFYGIGYVFKQDSHYGHYLVIIIAERK